MKRLLDLVVGIFGIITFSPIFLIIGLILIFKLGRPIFFIQKRPGLHCIPFSFYKFRTMNEERDSKGELLPDDLRLSSFGHWLRKKSLDELPSLWNVIKGDISLVGPRPLLMEYIPLYSKYQARRHEIKPGITGWAQINGRNSISWSRKFELDVWYVENQSFWLDLKILFKTLWKVFSMEGISHAGHVTMKKFKGMDDK